MLEWVVERRIHLDFLLRPFVQDDVDLGLVELGHELRPRSTLNAVVGPEARLVRLGGVGGVNDGGEGRER